MGPGMVSAIVPRPVLGDHHNISLLYCDHRRFPVCYYFDFGFFRENVEINLFFYRKSVNL
jgi:hypothetical protein